MSWSIVKEIFSKGDSWNLLSSVSIPRGMSAVCVYTIADIDRIFKTSNFKGHPGSVPSPRPGEVYSTIYSTIWLFIQRHSFTLYVYNIGLCSVYVFVCWSIHMCPSSCSVLKTVLNSPLKSWRWWTRFQRWRSGSPVGLSWSLTAITTTSAWTESKAKGMSCFCL